MRKKQPTFSRPPTSDSQVVYVIGEIESAKEFGWEDKYLSVSLENSAGNDQNVCIKSLIADVRYHSTDNQFSASHSMGAKRGSTNFSFPFFHSFTQAGFQINVLSSFFVSL